MANATVTLYLLRHAHAGDASRWTGPDDQRPLSAKGKRQAKRLADHLAALKPSLEVIVSSPKVRAHETAEPVAAALGLTVQIDDRVTGGLTLAALEEVLVGAGDPASAMVVGHDPDFSELAAELSGAASLPMRKAALARFDGSRPLRSAGLTLRWLIPPDALPEEGSN